MATSAHEKFDLIILGGGAAGIFAACHAEGKVLLIEKTAQLLSKVRISGGALDTGEMKLTVLNKNGRLGLMGLFINALSNNYEK